jgi:hypothetical protein
MAPAGRRRMDEKKILENLGIKFTQHVNCQTLGRSLPFSSFSDVNIFRNIKKDLIREGACEVCTMSSLRRAVLWSLLPRSDREPPFILTSD